MQLSGVFTEVLAVLPATGAYRSPVVRHFPTFEDSKSLHSSGFFKSCHPFSVSKLGIKSYKSRSRSFTGRAAATSEGDLVPVAPLQFESPTCQLLAQILQMHPHLLPAAIDQQLENLQGDGDAQGEESSSLSQDLLYKVMPVNKHTVLNIAMGFDSKSEHSTGGADYYSFDIETVRYFWAL